MHRYTSGTVYDGEWRENKKNGRGVYRYADGDLYEGKVNKCLFIY